VSASLSEALSRPLQVVGDRERRHRAWLALGAGATVVLIVVLFLYGMDYYLTDQAHRPFSPKHAQLKPSGTVGLRLGNLGLVMFFLIYLYPLRKRWFWLGTKGQTRHWLDYHVLFGIAAPLIITFHSAFKTHGFAGMAYWVMIALALSGIVGRYFYAQIPRRLGEAEMSLNELAEVNLRLRERLDSQRLFPPHLVDSLFRMPAAEEVRNMPLGRALFWMVWLDLSRPAAAWKLRRWAQRWLRGRQPAGEIIPSRCRELREAVSALSRGAALAKRALFLSRAQRVFSLWHAVHRPFSISLALLVVIHVTLVLLLGFY
jgi:hypothetical protein